MALRVFNKLVRDLIPEQLTARGIKVTYSVIGDFFGRDRFSREKLVEEAGEVLKANTREELIGELADVADTFELVLRVNKVTPEELSLARAKKNKEKGGFEQFYYLESTEETDGHPK